METKNYRFRRESDRNPALDKVTRDILFLEVILRQRLQWRGERAPWGRLGTGSLLGGISGTVRQAESRFPPMGWMWKSRLLWQCHASIRCGGAPSPLLVPKGWPDSADVGAGVCLGGWHDPESSVLDPHTRLFLSWDCHGGVISTPSHVDMGAGRLPVEHLGARQDQRLPFYLEPCFGVPAVKSAASCGHWRTENPQSGFGSLRAHYVPWGCGAPPTNLRAHNALKAPR